jgi:hypothetical protein
MLHRSAMKWLLTTCVLFSGTCLTAAPPMFSLLPFRKVEANDQTDYTLTKQNGPWIIMATSLSGETAEMDARKLALELRRDYKLQSYVHKQEYALEETVQGLGVNAIGKPKKMKYANNAMVEEWAIVVGNFPSIDDPDAQRALEIVRTAQPRSLGAVAGPKKDQPVSIQMVREYYRKVTNSKEKKPEGPLGKAFVTRNPLLPKQEVAKGSLDSFVRDMNDGVDYSLLQNKHKYTVQIAVFRGATSFNENEFNQSIQKNRNTSKIDEAALKAAKMTAALRKEGVEAYVFHDRFESLVAVGGFDDLGTKNSTGRTELHADVAAIIKRYEAQRQPLPGSDQLGLSPRLIAGIPCDVSPRLIQVPRQNLADIYSAPSE